MLNLQPQNSTGLRFRVGSLRFRVGGLRIRVGVLGWVAVSRKPTQPRLSSWQRQGSASAESQAASVHTNLGLGFGVGGLGIIGFRA